MKQLILVLAVAVALTSCAAGDSTPTSQTEKVANTTADPGQDELETTAAAAESGDQSEAAAGAIKYNTVCVNERATGSRRRTRVCRDIEITQ